MNSNPKTQKLKLIYSHLIDIECWNYEAYVPFIYAVSK
jgi:hypothetical protein